MDLAIVGLTGFILYRFLVYLSRLLEKREAEFHSIVHGMSSVSGDSFFQVLVQNLCRTLKADYAFICEFSDQDKSRVKSVAVCADGSVVDNIEFELDGTPCNEVVKHGLRSYPRELQKLFPMDHLAQELEVESYVGIPLLDSRGQVMGPMAVFSRTPFVNLRLAESMLQLFAVRAAAELERRHAESTISYITCHDTVTGLPNRRMFVELLNSALLQALKQREVLAVGVLGLDNFKKVNETLGHTKGDQLLKLVAETLNGRIRAQDILSRLAGDRFLLLLPGIDRVEEIPELVSRAVRTFHEPFILDELEIHLKASIGVAIYPEDGQESEVLLKNADSAQNRARGSGFNAVQFYTADMNAKALTRLGLESMLRRALDERQFVLHYQPQCELATGRVSACEALIRWAHPEKGLIPPDDFVPLIEDIGLVVPIGRWVISEACRQGVLLQEQLGESLQVAVNLAAPQFYQDDLLSAVKQGLNRSGARPEMLELEITERILMEDVDQAVEKLSALRRLGVKITIDDFGTGYSSLNYLRQFPVTALKIDRSFIKDIGRHSDSAAIVSSIISLAHNLGLEVVGEGVETEEQLEFLRTRRCDKIQGFLICQAVPCEQMGDRLSGIDAVLQDLQAEEPHDPSQALLLCRQCSREVGIEHPLPTW